VDMRDRFGMGRRGTCAGAMAMNTQDTMFISFAEDLSDCVYACGRCRTRVLLGGVAVGGAVYDLDKINQRLSRHWRWLGISTLLLLLVLASAASSLLHDMGGFDHVRKTGVLTSLSQAMTNDLMGALQHRPDAKTTRATMAPAVIHLVLFVLLAAIMEGRLKAINRLGRLREEMQLRA
jgi:hypothetical protein